MNIRIIKMKFAKSSNHHEIYTDIVDADRIILDTSSKRFEIDTKAMKEGINFGYPNQFIRCLLITEKNKKKTIHGFFTKIALYLDSNENYLGIISLEEVFMRDEIEEFFKKEYKNLSKAEKVDVQTISIDDFLIQSRISLMKEGRKLFKRRRNVK